MEYLLLVAAIAKNGDRLHLWETTVYNSQTACNQQLLWTAQDYDLPVNQYTSGELIADGYNKQNVFLHISCTELPKG